MPTRDPRVDAYIRRAAPFARPILARLRRVVHAGCPNVEETIKWSFPHFDYKGILCRMAAFKHHVAFGFWKARLLSERGLTTIDRTAMGHFGRIASVNDLPSEAALRRLVKAAAALNEAGAKVERAPRTRRPRVRPPAYFVASLKKSPKARATFEAFPPSHRREYVDWVTEAKTDETRRRRLAQAIEWMAAGKPRNWKYLSRRTP